MPLPVSTRTDTAGTVTAYSREIEDPMRDEV